MHEDDGRTGDTGPERDFTSLPPTVRLDETVESIDPDAPPDPEAGRNGDHHRALRDG